MTRLSAKILCRRALVELSANRAARAKTGGFPAYGSVLRASGGQRDWTVSRKIDPNDLGQSLDGFMETVFGSLVRELDAQSAAFHLSYEMEPVSKGALDNASERYDGVAMKCDIVPGVDISGKPQLLLSLSVRSGSVTMAEAA